MVLMTCPMVSRPTTSAVRYVALFCVPDRRPGERIDHVEAEFELRGVVHRRQHRKDADAVGDEVGRVLGADHALAQRGGEEFFELVEDDRDRCPGVRE